jgi:phage tail-like protein
MPAAHDDAPHRNFNFRVDIGSAELAFQEVHIPAARLVVVEYRTGEDKFSGTRKLPGREETGNLVLRRGIDHDLALWEWYDAARKGTLQRRDVLIALLTPDRATTVRSWKVLAAWPVAYESSPLHAQGNDVVIETLELACERLEIEN